MQSSKQKRIAKNLFSTFLVYHSEEKSISFHNCHTENYLINILDGKLGEGWRIYYSLEAQIFGTTICEIIDGSFGMRKDPADGILIFDMILRFLHSFHFILFA